MNSTFWFLIYLLIGLTLAVIFDRVNGIGVPNRIRVLGFIFLWVSYPIFIIIWIFRRRYGGIK